MVDRSSAGGVREHLSSDELDAHDAVASPRGRFFHGVVGRLRAVRAQLRRHPLLALSYRIAVGLVGGLVLVVGIIAIPYPGPGWLIVFTGLGILATEFEWARRILRWALERYRMVMAWYSRQHGVVRWAGIALTGAITLGTLWFVGALGLFAGWFGVHWSWLQGVLM
ncbi:TIGR02611 family protein [Hoyosella rhizosphaerae]|uniref:TIGR02611 family protein n=2 Tax=Hoyosella rhizosphaerae TaxID=1755582 RepID=A0A916U4Y0_9ACTN|nr:TIGR02611 family protein [Hoyosella rhizosphaerae]GGC59619.1 hypothetical protein GCM10011410_10060 [Hoyosella rhizosphaerae]